MSSSIHAAERELHHPPMPEGAEDGIIKRHLPAARRQRRSPGQHVRLIGAGSILREVIAAADCWRRAGRYDEIWSVTSFTELQAKGTTRNGGICCIPKPTRSAVRHPQRISERGDGPVIASTDYMKPLCRSGLRPSVPEQVLGSRH